MVINTQPTEHYITSSEAAKMLGISQTGFYRLETMGYIKPKSNDGYKKMYSKEDIIELAKTLINQSSTIHSQKKDSLTTLSNNKTNSEIKQIESIATLGSLGIENAPNSNSKNTKKTSNKFKINFTKNYIKTPLKKASKFIKTNRKKIFPFAIGMAAILIPLVIYSIKNNEEAQAAWWNDDWQYRQKVTVSNTGAADSDKKILLDMDTATLVTNEKMQADYDDIRVTDVNGNPVEFYIDSSGSGNSGSGPESETTGTRTTSGDVKIGDASDLGGIGGTTIPTSIVTTSNGAIYAVLEDNGSDIEVWKSTDGSSWTQQDSGTTITGYDPAVAVDSNDTLHICFTDSTDTSYRQFDTSSDAWNTTIGEETVKTYLAGSAACAIAVDAYDIPHVISTGTGAVNNEANYHTRNDSWTGSVNIYTSSGGGNSAGVSLTFNEDNIPEVALAEITGITNPLSAHVGNQTYATSFTSQDIVADIFGTGQVTDIAVDAEGNTWVSYIEKANQYVSLIKHNDADPWTTWQTPVNNTNVGYEPTIAVIGKTIIVFYEEDSTDQKIVYDAYDGGTAAWLGEQNVASTASTDYQDASVRWSYFNNFDERYLDVLYSDGTDVYWDAVDVRPFDDSSFLEASSNIDNNSIVISQDGSLYAIGTDEFAASHSLEVWKSSDGIVWEEQDTSNKPTISSGENFKPPHIEIDENQLIHIAYGEGELLGPSSDVFYTTFDTTTDQFNSGSAASVDTIHSNGSSFGAAPSDIAVDSNNVPHIIYQSGSSTLEYENRIGGSWSGIQVESGGSSSNLIINEDASGGVPEIIYINGTTLKAALGDGNNPSSFSTVTIDSTITGSNPSISLDQRTGDTWVSYVDSDGTIALAKHPDASAWTSDWTTITTKADEGTTPSIQIINDNIYVIYEDENDDIAYDVYTMSSSSWSGESVVHTGTYTTPRFNQSYDYNQYGTSRLYYSFDNSSSGANRDYLHLRDMPSSIVDAFDTTATNSQKTITRNSSGTLYMVRHDVTNKDIEIWKSYDNGKSWSQKDSANSPTSKVDSGTISYSLEIDSNDILHIVWPYDNGTGSDHRLSYVTFDTGTDTFGSTENIDTDTSNSFTQSNITIDTNDIPHVVYSFNGTTYYSNRVVGSWDVTPVTIEAVTSFSSDIVINEDNIPEIVYNQSSSILKAAVGNQNDASSFTTHDVESSISLNDNGSRIGIDADGNTWISYTDETGTYDTVSLAKHDDASGWTTGWTTAITNSAYGENPVFAINGTDIYLYYKNTDDDNSINYAIYDGSTWSSEYMLEYNKNGILSIPHFGINWNYLNNFGSDGVSYSSGSGGLPEIDYYYFRSTNTDDGFYNKLEFSSSCSNTCIYLYDDTINAGNNVYYIYYGNPEASNGMANQQFSVNTFTPSADPTYGSEEIGPGPVGYWPMDTVQSSTVQDVTVNRNNGDTTGTAYGVDVEKQISILNQEYLSTGTTAPGDNSLGLIYWDDNAYSDETVYFEAIIRCDSCTGGNTEVDAALYDDTGAVVSGSTVSTTSSTYTRLRSSALTLTDNEEYTAAITRDATGGTAYIKAARLIVKHSGGTSLTATENQVEMGTDFSTTNTSATSQTDPKYYQYDHDNFDGTINSYFEATLKSTDSTSNLSTGASFPGTVTTSNATVPYDENDWDNPTNITADDGTNYASVTSPTFDSPDYTYTLEATNFGFNLPAGATVVGVEVTVDRRYENGTVSDALVQLIKGGTKSGNNLSTGAAWPASDTEITFGSSTNLAGTWGVTLSDTDVEASNFGVAIAAQASGANADAYVDYVAVNVYYDVTVNYNAYAELYNRTNSTVVSTLSTTSTSWDRQRSSALSTNWDTTNDDEYEVRVYAESGGTASISNAKIITQQTGTITKTQSVLDFNNAVSTDADSTYTGQSFDQYFDPTAFLYSGTSPAYFESVLKTSSGADAYFARTDLPAGEVTASDTTYTRKTSSDIWSSLPSSAQNIDVELRNNASSTTSSSVSRLIINSSDLTQYFGTSPTLQPPELCKRDKCLLFDGSEHKVTITNDLSIDLDGNMASGFTFMGWVKALSDGENDAGEIFSKGTNTYLRTTNEGSDGKLDLEASLDLGTTNATLSALDALEVNKWHHVALAYTDDGDDEITLYVDGRNVKSSTDGDGSPSADTNDLLIAGDIANNFHGFIDEFKVYPYERTATEIKNNAVIETGSVEGTSVDIGSASTDFLTNGLVGYWKLDENSADTCTTEGDDACDSTGNDNGGTWNGNSANTPAVYGNGVSFDGSSDYIEIGDVDELEGFNNMTISLWFNTSSISNYDKIIAKNVNTTSGGYWVQLHTDGWVGLGAAASSSGVCDIRTANGTISTDTWYHYVGVIDDDSCDIYLNGEFSPAANASGQDRSSESIASNTYPLRFGKRGDAATSQDFAGKLDEIRIYDRALTASEVRDLYEWTPEPVGYWKFDENTGTTTTYDSSSNANDLTLTSITEADWVNGRFGSALSYDGSANSATRADDADFDFAAAQGFTVEAWVKHNGAISSSFDYILSKADTTTGGYKLYMDDTGDFCFVTDDDASWDTDDSACTSGVDYDDGEWYHVAGVKDGTTSLTLYVDGVEVASDTSIIDTGTLENGDALYIGVDRDGTSNEWDGVIDEVKIYNYVRSQGQIIEDMNGGHPIGGSPIGSQLAYWKFDETYGDTANDTVGNYNGDLAGSGTSCGTTGACPTWTTDGKSNGAMYFDHTERDYVEISGLMGSPPNITVSAWVNYLNSDTFGGEIFSIGDYVTLRVDNGGSANDITAFYYDGSSWNSTDADYDIQNTGWRHVAYTIDDATDVQRLYLDGQIIAETAFTGSISYSTLGSNTFIGRNGDGGTSHDYGGYLDEVKVYSAALTQDEILIDMNRGSAAAFGSVMGVNEDAYLQSGTLGSPILYFNFDENQGTTSISDISGQGETGTMEGSMTESDWVRGPKGYNSALEFDGTDDQIDFYSSNFASNFNGDNGSISVWFKQPDWGTGTKDIIRISSDANNEVVLRKSTTNSFLYRFESNANGDQHTHTFSDTGWNNAVITWDYANDLVVYYMNGQVVSTDTGIGTNQWSGSPAADVTCIGSQNCGTTTQQWDGALDEIRVYDYTLTQAQVSYLYNRGLPIAHYKLDECQSTTANDASGNGNNGTITPGAGTAPDNNSAGTCSSGNTDEMWNDGTTGKLNSGLGFDGTDDYVDMNDVNEVDFNDQDFTLTGWFNRSTFANDHTIIAKRNGIANTDQGYIVYIDDANDNLVFEVCDNTVSCDEYQLSSLSQFTSAGWNHFAIVWDDDSAANTEIYINGIADNATDTGTIGNIGDLSNSVDLRLGSESDGANYFEGILDDIRIYNYTLSPSQIIQVMTGQNAQRFGPSSGSP